MKASTGRELLMLYGKTDAIADVSFCPDTRCLMVSCTGAGITFQDAYNWTLTREQIEQQRLEAYRAFMAEGAAASKPGAEE